MPKFSILKINPNQNQQEIKQLWDRYLPGTPMDRFEWMNNNPAGPPDWFFAQDPKNKTIAGMISIMPKWLNCQGQRYRAGMVGDFVVKKEYQVFGPSIALLKAVIEQHQKLGYSFLYTLPNPNAATVCLRGGFVQMAATDRFVKVLCPGKKVSGYLPKIMRPLTTAVLDSGYKLISKETYMDTGLSDAGIDNIVQLEGDLAIEPNSAEYTKGEQTSRYIEWRYSRNPICQFKAGVYREHPDGHKVGKIIYAISDSRLHVFDLWSAGKEYFDNTVAHFIKSKRKEGFESISIRLMENTALSSAFRKHGFIARNEKIPILFSGNAEEISKNWHFFDGDRNV